MTTLEDRGRLEAEVAELDLPTLKKKRSNLLRSTTRCDTYLRELQTKPTKELDAKGISVRRYKLLQDTVTADVVHDAIVSFLKEVDIDGEEADYSVESTRMITLGSALEAEEEAARLYRRCRTIRRSMDSLADLPKLDGCHVAPTLWDLQEKLSGMQESADTISSRPELMDGIQALIRDLRGLQLRHGEDTAPSAPVSSSKPKGMSKFDRLPRMPLPDFDGTAVGWRPFWEKFRNTLSKDDGLTDVDRLAFLNMTVKTEEAKLIIESVTRSGPHFDAAIKALQDRYDQPRQTSRTSLQAVLKHTIDLTSEGISKTISLFQTSLAVLKECTDATLDTLYTLILELIMPPKLFQDWTEYSSKHKKTPTFEDVAEYLRRYQMRFYGRTDAVKSPATQTPVTKPPAVAQQRKPWKPPVLHQSSKDCALCHDGPHPLYMCETFRAKGVEDKNSTASRLKVCTNCLSLNHLARDCSSNRSCRDCGKRHHTLLHRHKQNSPAGGQPPSAPLATNAHVTPACYTVHSKQQALISTCWVAVESGGHRSTARALIDSGSHLTFMTSKLAQSLKVRKLKEATSLVGIAQIEAPSCHYKADLALVPPGRPAVDCRAVIIDNITGDLPGMQLHGVREKPFIKNLELADPHFDRPGRIDMLIGSDYVDTIMLRGKHSSSDGMLHALETTFGWIIRGRCYPDQPTTEHPPCLHVNTADPTTDELLAALWQVEEPPSEPDYTSEEEQQALQHFKTTHSRTEEGRYIVNLPRRSISLPLGCSRGQAVKRFHANKRSLVAKGQFGNFTNALLEYQAMGHAEPVPEEDLRKPESETYYLPAHGVTKKSSTTTKLRVVFDASARTSTGISLNQILLPGPNLYPLLTNVVLSFRSHSIGMTADISKMFREIQLHPDDRDLHRFLQPSCCGEGLTEMRMKRLTFGITSSPFLATQVLRQTASDHQAEHPRAADIVLNHFYVDDCLTGASTIEEAVEIREELNALLDHACMSLRKWRSSSPELLQSVPEEMREEENLQLFSPPAECHKALGVHWNTQTDTLHVATPVLTPEDRPTKRKIASDVARTFDLMGWFAPSTILVKVLLQRLWKLKLGWDDPVPESIAQEWRKWRQDLHIITEHPIQRHHLEKRKTVRSMQLHGFSDASDAAYAGVVYLRVLYTDTTVSTALLYAKTKVAPLAGATIPRLELLGANILSKLLSTVANVLHIPPADIFAWSDSTITLCWIHEPPGKGMLYEHNRVRETVQRVPAEHWRHVPTLCNPADVASRGAIPRVLVDFRLWWEGPTWLRLAPSEWPCRTDWKKQRVKSEEPPTVLIAIPLIDLTEAFSSYANLKRILCWCTRFINNCKTPAAERLLSRRLSLSELQRTEETLLKLSQGRSFRSDLDALHAGGVVSRQSTLLHLCPYLDEKGLIRVGGRLERSSATASQKHPVILHRSDRFAKLLCTQIHIDNLHVGPTALLAIVSLRFHIIGLKHLVKGVSRACVRCKKAYAKTTSQRMGQLPPCRVTPSTPFHHTGADFAGPLMVRRGFTRSRVMEKIYICIFVCMATKAVHLEVVRDLTTEGFLSALRCFIARRGYPFTFTTDNGSNFVGAQRELQGIYQLIQSPVTQEALDRFCTTNNMQWKHIPARSPHFGGLWEAAVKSMKLLMVKIIGPHTLMMDDLYAVTVEIEAALNSRPLIPLDSAPADGVEVLTPGHFLVGKALKSCPVSDFSNRKLNRLTRWDLQQRLSADLWQRWSKEYISSLQAIRRWKHPQRSIRTGDIVLIKDTDLFTRSWPLARVTQVHAGDDGLVRVATVRTSKGTFKRAVHKLVLLLEDEEDLLSLAPPG